MHTLTLPQTKRISVIIAGRGGVNGQSVTTRMLALAARLALRGPLMLFDCGNRANPLPLARELRRLTPDPVRALRNIQVARAFTCYQTLALLEGVRSLSEHPPLILFDVLASFYDESVPYAESLRLLRQSLAYLTEISQSCAVLISSRPPPADFPERAAFVHLLCQVADPYWIETVPQPAAPQQLSLFA